MASKLKVYIELRNGRRIRVSKQRACKILSLGFQGSEAFRHFMGRWEQGKTGQVREYTFAGPGVAVLSKKWSIVGVGGDLAGGGWRGYSLQDDKISNGIETIEVI